MITDNEKYDKTRQTENLDTLSPLKKGIRGTEADQSVQTISNLDQTRGTFDQYSSPKHMGGKDFNFP